MKRIKMIPIILISLAFSVMSQEAKSFGSHMFYVRNDESNAAKNELIYFLYLPDSEVRNAGYYVFLNEAKKQVLMGTDSWLYFYNSVINYYGNAKTDGKIEGKQSIAEIDVRVDGKDVKMAVDVYFKAKSPFDRSFVMTIPGFGQYWLTPTKIDDFWNVFNPRNIGRIDLENRK